MMDVDSSDMPKYLKVSEAKLKSKGVMSVRSRVTNLCEYLPKYAAPADATPEQRAKARKKMIKIMQDAMVQAFERTYGGEAEEIEIPDIPQDIIDKYQSEEWRYGEKIPFEKEIEHRFEWGEVDIQLMMKGGYISKCRIYSDALEFSMFDNLQEALLAVKYDAHTIKAMTLAHDLTNREREVLQLIAANID